MELGLTHQRTLLLLNSQQPHTVPPRLTPPRRLLLAMEAILLVHCPSTTFALNFPFLCRYTPEQSLTHSRTHTSSEELPLNIHALYSMSSLGVQGLKSGHAQHNVPSR